MTNYSQRDWRWSWKQLGFCRTSIGKDGCAVTSLGIMADRRPDEVNDILKNGGGFLAGCLVIWDRAASLLGLEWAGSGKTRQFFPCIADVRFGNDMHFVVMLDEKTIIDPWDGTRKNNPYPIVSYINIRPKVIAPYTETAKYPRAVEVIVPTLYVRCQPTRNSGLCGSQVLHQGDRFIAVGEVVGELVGNTNIWVKSQKGNYVWKGGLRV